MLELLFLLLPVAAGYGWVMGRNSLRQAQRKQSKILSRHYFKGLNFLLSDQPDKAVDTLIKMINLDSDTADTHIAMGNFFRHRGELDRAIKIHQNLVNQKDVDTAHQHAALQELGKDYIQAGFLERAENAFTQLLQSEKHALEAQTQLFNIYQTTKEWDRGIELAEKLFAIQGETDEICQRISHFYCEQAQLLVRKGDDKEAEKLLHRAIMSDEKNVRPWLLLADIAIRTQDYDQAMDYLGEVPKRDVSWFSEAVPLLEKCAESSDNWEKLEAMLEQYWQKCATAYLAKVNLLARRGDKPKAAEVLLEQLRTHPTMKGFKTLMKLYIELQAQQQATDSLQLLSELVEAQINQRPKYRCHGCGFSGRQIHWLCPSCKKWGLVKPIKGLDGE